MSFAIGARSQSIYQPLELAHLPTAEVKTLSFDNYQQKQEQELRVDPAVEARQLRQQRADAQGAIPDHSAGLEGAQDVSSSPPIDTLQSLFQRQQLMSSITAGEHTALQSGQLTELKATIQQQPADTTLSTAIPATPATPATPSGSSAGQQDIEAMMAARSPDPNDSNKPADLATKRAEAKEAEERRQQKATDDAVTERKLNAEQITEFVDAIRKGETLEKDKSEDAPAEFSQKGASDNKTPPKADPYLAAMKQTTAMNPSLSAHALPQQSSTGHSALAQQIRTDNFIADIQNMQAMQFGTAKGSQLSAAA